MRLKDSKMKNPFQYILNRLLITVNINTAVIVNQPVRIYPIEIALIFQSKKCINEYVYPTCNIAPINVAMNNGKIIPVLIRKS